jgi:hypothetical protein
VKTNWNIGMVECWNDGETVKTVELNLVHSPTLLKQGVNESKAFLSCISSISWLIPK